MAKTQALVVLLILAALIPALAAGPTQTALNYSINQVEAAPQTGPLDPRKPFVTRLVLKQAETDAPMEFEVALKMRNFSELQQRVAQGAIISPQEMAQKYNPAAADEQAVADWLTGQGLTLVRRDKNHLAIFVRGTVSQVERALQVKFGRVALEGKEYTSAVSAPSVPGTLAPLLVGVNGLQPHLHPHKHSFSPSSLTGTGAPYTPSQIAQVYNAGGLYQSNITGAGQAIGIIIDTFPSTGDLQGFWSTYSVNQSLSNFTFIQVVAGSLPAPTGEETLDTEWSSAMAPGAKVRVYATLDLSNADIDRAYQQVYTDVTTHPEYGIHQISMSFAEGETATTNSQVQTDDQFFAELASAGVTIFASSGDGGAYPNNSGQSGGNTAEQAVAPASDPNVTAVGGTSLQLDSSGNVSSEVAWSLSGGGPSRYFNRPSWQVGQGVPPGNSRLVPDLAASADPAYGAAYYFNGTQQTTGGTSWSSPTWAGFCALINQVRAKAGLASIGLLGPRIYPLLGTANFRDITSGGNGLNAGVGYDLATGIGVPNVQTLAQTLAGAPVTSTYKPTPTPILHSFNDGGVVADGQSPVGMIQGIDGNFYGVTSGGGSKGIGTVFKITAQGSITILHQFGDGTTANDGSGPNAGLVQDSSGNLYGTTMAGGANGYGTIFKTTLGGTTTTLYSFNAGFLNGSSSETGMVAGVDGNFYGITTKNQFYQITPGGSFTILQTLNNVNCADSYVPMIRGMDGNFYGTTLYNDIFTGGSAFMVTPQGVAKVLFYFGYGGTIPIVSGQPEGQLVQGPDGNFYGTTAGPIGGDTIFEMTLQGAITVLHHFNDGSVANDGQNPTGTLVIGTDGNLYGTTSAGGTAGKGVIFKMTLGTQNVVSIVHSFGDGSTPNDGTGTANLVQGSNGLIYGTSGAGGANNQGTAFVMNYFTSAASTTFTIGYLGSFNVTTAYEPNATISATGLPSWATLNSSTGVLSGTPPSDSAGTYPVTFTVSNGANEPTNVQSFSLVVVPPTPPAFTSVTPTSSATAGTAYSFSCQASGYPAPGNYTLTAGSLPPGLTLASSGTISGTPTQGGLYTGTISVSNGVGSPATQNFSIAVQQQVAFTSSPLNAVMTVGDPFSFTFQATGYPPPTFSVDSGLPAGITLSSGGVLSGTPAVGSGGVYNVGFIYASNTYGQYGSSASQVLSIAVQEAPKISASTPPSPVLVNTSYYFDFSYGATGYPTPIYTLTSGAFPTGLSMTSAGVLAGTPTVTGTFSGTVSSSNGIIPAATENFIITIDPPTPPAITNAASANAMVGFPFNFTFQATGLPAPTYSVIAGSGPPGLYEDGYYSFSQFVWSGAVSGTPTQAGTYNFTVAASNGTTPNAVQNFTLTVLNPSYSAWAGIHFTAQQLTESRTSGPSAMPENDGVPNLLKYLYDINPTVPMSATDRAAMPVMGTAMISGSEYLTVTYRQYQYLAGVTVNVQTSPDLQTWTTVTPDLTQQVGTDSTTLDPIIEDEVNMHGATKEFIRFNLVQP